MNSNQRHGYAVDALNGLDMSSLLEAVEAPPPREVRPPTNRGTEPNPVVYLMAALAESVAVPAEARHG